ncbi:type II toxin-antitoxin system HicA family toxin [Desulfonatronum thioautotrophicum]|uniref:type II toxin-antitoxin system HicA family toxin n=1 Tax=Desulfonatronum thioautotrophicum TaxID=617001 RepID=UPI0005EB0DE5|nr:type II toxin-antitoxin system HicA family toxin [Desulfonatronum thioautotrophicum]
MTRHEKLLERAQNSPQDLTFAEFQTLLRQVGWVLDHQKGSHQIWYSPKGKRLPIQRGKSGKAKGYQVKQLLIACQEGESDEN